MRGGPGDTCCPLLPALPACWERAWLKCENFQNTGSFKLRGVAAQFAALDTAAAAAGLVTMSAGNYGRSFSVAAQQLGLAATVCMPDTAPDSREAVMRGHGAEVERMPSSALEAGVRRHRDQGKVFLHPSDDLSLIAGHASLGLEILEDVPEVEVVVVCCGGGGLLAGVAAAIKVTRYQAPPTATPTRAADQARGPRVRRGARHGQHRARLPRRRGARAAARGQEHSSRPRAALRRGERFQVTRVEYSTSTPPPLCLHCSLSVSRHIAAHCDGVVTVSEQQLVAATLAAYTSGLVVEPSGAAGLAAVLGGQVSTVLYTYMYVLYCTVYR